jgi:hypothetical protein
MTKVSIVTSTAVVLFALLPSNATAQETTLRQELIGPWDIVSCDNKQQPVCANPSGSIAFTMSGRYIGVLTEKGRPKIANTGQGRASITPEDYKAIAQGVLIAVGTWSVDEASKTVTLRLENTLVPNAEGTEGKETVSLTGDELKTSGLAIGNAVWHRHGPAFVQQVSK